jgi:hypothetical protein
MCATVNHMNKKNTNWFFFRKRSNFFLFISSFNFFLFIYFLWKLSFKLPIKKCFYSLKLAASSLLCSTAHVLHQSTESTPVLNPQLEQREDVAPILCNKKNTNNVANPIPSFRSQTPFEYRRPVLNTQWSSARTELPLSRDQNGNWQERPSGSAVKWARATHPLWLGLR